MQQGERDGKRCRDESDWDDRTLQYSIAHIVSQQLI